MVGFAVGRPFGKLDIEDFRHVGGERDLVGGRRMGAQPPLAIPPQFFRRQPAHALNEAAFDLALVDGRVQRAADIVEHIGAVDDIFAGQRIDRDFRNGGAIGVIIERVVRVRSSGPSGFPGVL